MGLIYVMLIFCVITRIFTRADLEDRYARVTFCLHICYVSGGIWDMAPRVCKLKSLSSSPKKINAKYATGYRWTLYAKLLRSLAKLSNQTEST